MSVTPIPSHEKTVNWFTLTQAINYLVHNFTHFGVRILKSVLLAQQIALLDKRLSLGDKCSLRDVLIFNIHLDPFPWLLSRSAFKIFIISFFFLLRIERLSGLAFGHTFYLLRRPDWTALLVLVYRVSVYILNRLNSTRTMWALTRFGLLVFCLRRRKACTVILLSRA